jgi:hypothetical protein
MRHFGSLQVIPIQIILKKILTNVLKTQIKKINTIIFFEK